jgi:hypothetical protein
MLSTFPRSFGLCKEYLTLGASLLVLASHEYDVNDYIDDPLEAARLRIETTSSPVGD